MADKKENEKISIPDSAVDKESAVSEKSPNKDLAKNEDALIESAQYGEKLKNSFDLTQLLHLCLYRYGVTLIFTLACITVIFIFWVFGSMIYEYSKYVMAEPTRLEEFLGEVWKILTGASVIIFVQLLGWTIKRKADELKDSKRR